MTSIVSKKATDLLILEFLLQKGKLIEHLHDYGVVCSEDEAKVFKSSGAPENSENSKSILKSHTEGLVQAIADNFDTDISSENGKIQTHPLAVIMAQPCNSNESSDKETFVTLKKTEVKDSSLLNTTIQHCTGPKKPKIPPYVVPQRIHTATL